MAKNPASPRCGYISRTHLLGLWFFQNQAVAFASIVAPPAVELAESTRPHSKLGLGAFIRVPPSINGSRLYHSRSGGAVLTSNTDRPQAFCHSVESDLGCSTFYPEDPRPDERPSRCLRRASRLYDYRRHPCVHQNPPLWPAILAERFLTSKNWSAMELVDGRLETVHEF